MSDMEQSYKEKYEQALSKAKDMLNYKEVRREDMEYLFPELAESEDENVRKEIINYFKCQSEEEPTRKEIHNKWIAWLENIPYTIDHEKREGFHLGYKACLERQGEQKPADSYCKENCKGFQETGKCFADGGCKAKREAEQESEKNKGNLGGISANWSVEDMSKVQRICKYLNEAKKYYADITEVRECIEWLKSLQDRVQPQPKQEWSEEDKYMYDILCGTIENTDINENTKYKLISWLKSLKDRVGCEANCTTTKEWSDDDDWTTTKIMKVLLGSKLFLTPEETNELVYWLKSIKGRVQHQPKYNFGDTELTQEELCEGLIRGMVDEHNRVTKEVLRNEYEKGRADVLAKIDAIDVDEMVCESGATSRVTQYWYAHGVNDVIKKLKEE